MLYLYHYSNNYYYQAELGVSGAEQAFWLLQSRPLGVGVRSRTTDAHRPYLQAVEEAFGSELDYAQLHKIYGAPTPDESRVIPRQLVSAAI
jgi:hypothetical protein